MKPLLRDRPIMALPRAPLMVALLLSTLLVLILTLAYYCPVVISHDTNEYMAMAELICQKFSSGPIGVAGISMVSLQEGLPFNRTFWRYPPGYPLVLSLPCHVWGPQGMFLVSPVLLFLTLMAFWHLCSRVAGGWMAVLALILVISTPSVTVDLICKLPHTLISLLLLIGLIFLDRWMMEMRSRDAFLCGFVTGCIPLVRYPEIVITLAVGVIVLVIVLRRKWSIWRQFGVFCIGAGISLTLLSVFNQINFGSPITTGYSLNGEQSDFSLIYFWKNIMPYLQLAVSECGAHIILLAVAGLILMMRTTGRRATAVALLLIVSASLLLYALFWRPADTRMILPCMFLVILAAAYFLRRLCSLVPRLALPVVASTVALSLFNALPHFCITLPEWYQTGQLLGQASNLVLCYCEPGQLVVANGLICQNLDLIGDYLLINLERLDTHSRSWISKMADDVSATGSFYLLGVSEIVESVERDLPAEYALVRLGSLQIPPERESSLSLLLPGPVATDTTSSALQESPLPGGHEMLELVRISRR